MVCQFISANQSASGLMNPVDLNGRTEHSTAVNSLSAVLPMIRPEIPVLLLVGRRGGSDSTAALAHQSHVCAAKRPHQRTVACRLRCLDNRVDFLLDYGAEQLLGNAFTET